jgi:AraC-like DNA-binding protein
LDECAIATGAGQFGLLLGLKARTQHLGVIGEMLRNAPTLGRAVRSFVEHHHRYARGGAPYVINQDPYLVRHKNEMLIGYRCMIPDLPSLQFLTASVGVGVSIIRELTNHGPSQVLLGCSPGHLPADEVRALLKPSAVVFDSHHFGLTYPRNVVEAPIAGADPLRYRQALLRIDDYCNGVEPDFVDQIRRRLLPVLLAERAHMRMLCESTGMHPRTINRRLAEQGTSLRAIVSETRYDIACQLLKHTHLPVGAVAEVMGYSEPGVFVRAFRHWSGATPEVWRKSLPLGQAKEARLASAPLSIQRT